MNKYTVSYLIPKIKNAFTLTMKGEINNIEEKKLQFQKHLEEYSSKGYELVSTSNLGYGVWFFWKKV